MPQRPQIKFTHIGIHVTDLERMGAFYRRVLGFTQTDHGTLESGHGRVELLFLSRDPDEHHQIVLVSGRPPAIDFNVVNQISLKAESITDLQGMHRLLCQEQVKGLRPITHGNAISLYFSDPEGNRIEIYVDTPWYVSQPARVPAPIELEPDELLEWAEEHARSLPGFRPRSEWREEMKLRMAADNTPSNTI